MIYKIKRFSVLDSGYQERYFASFNSIIRGLKKVGRSGAANATQTAQATAKATGKNLAMRAKETEAALQNAAKSSQIAQNQAARAAKIGDNMNWIQRNITNRGKYKRIQKLQQDTAASAEKAGASYREAVQNRDLAANQFNDFRAKVRKQKTDMEGVVGRQARRNAEKEAAQAAKQQAAEEQRLIHGDGKIKNNRGLRRKQQAAKNEQKRVRQEQGRTGEYTQQRGVKGQGKQNPNEYQGIFNKEMQAKKAALEARREASSNLPAVVEQPSAPVVTSPKSNLPAVVEQPSSTAVTTVSAAPQQPQQIGSVLKPEGNYVDFEEIPMAEEVVEGARQGSSSISTPAGTGAGFLGGLASGFGIGKWLGRGKQGMSTGTKIALGAGGAGLAGAGYMAGQRRQAAFSIKRFSKIDR